jgi:hypothetical protein
MTNKTRKGDAPVIRTCGHQGTVSIFLDKVPKLRCAKCGNRNPIICSRDRSRVWSGQRRGR